MPSQNQHTLEILLYLIIIHVCPHNESTESANELFLAQGGGMLPVCACYSIYTYPAAWGAIVTCTVLRRADAAR